MKESKTDFQILRLFPMGSFDLLKRQNKQNNTEQVTESHDNFLYYTLFSG